MPSSIGQGQRRLVRNHNPFHSCSLRVGRRSLPGQIYIITTTTQHRRRLFAEFELACSASRALSEQRLWRDSCLLAWVLMPDHWHGLVQLDGSEPLSTLVGRAKAVCAKAVNGARGSRSPVWQAGFHDRAIRDDESLRQAARYLIANPVRAGLVDVPARYSFWDAVWVGADGELA